MNHLATPSSRVPNSGLIEEEDNANTLQPSLLQSTQIPEGQHTYPSTSSEFDRPSGTSNDTLGDEDVESIAALDEYYDARSEVSISSLRSAKSSFRRVASASQESLASFRSTLFAPSFGTLNVTVWQLVDYLNSEHRISRAEILDMTTYQSRTMIRHMFVVLRLKQGRKECWLRLDRRAEDPLNASFIFSSMQGPTQDVAKAASKLEELVKASDVKEHSRIVFENPPSVRVLEGLLVGIYEESKLYRLWPENCWFFCSLMQEHLSCRHGGNFTFGELFQPNLGSDARGRISRRLDGIQLANISASRSLSLLYKVVPRPLLRSAVIAEVNLSQHLQDGPCYLLFAPETRILLGSYDGIIRVLDLSLREIIKITSEDASQVGDWASLLDGRIIVSGSLMESYNFWDATSGTPVRFSTASRGSEGLDFTHLTSAPDDLTTQRWERVIRDVDRWQGHPRVRNETHNRVAYTSGGSILVDEESSNTRIASLTVGPRLWEDLILSPSGKSISFRLHDSHDSYLWNIDTQTVYRLDETLPDPDFWTRAWSPDGHYIAIEREGDFTVYDTRTGALVSILNFGPIFWSKLRFSPDGRYFVAADYEGRVKLWDMEIALLYGPTRSNRPLSRHNGMVDFSQ